MNDEMDEGNLTQMDVDHDKDNEQEVVINEELNLEVWGLLKNKHHTSDHRLVHRDQNGRRDCYIIGRSKSCDVVINHPQVSASHCFIYCDYESARLRVFVEDHSKCGTYVNSSLTRLSKGERIELSNGDEIYLLNPLTDKEGIGAFVFINMRERYIMHIQRVKMQGIQAPPTLALHRGDSLEHEADNNNSNGISFDYGDSSNMNVNANGHEWEWINRDSDTNSNSIPTNNNNTNNTNNTNTNNNGTSRRIVTTAIAPPCAHTPVDGASSTPFRTAKDVYSDINTHGSAIGSSSNSSSSSSSSKNNTRSNGMDPQQEPKSHQYLQQQQPYHTHINNSGNDKTREGAYTTAANANPKPTVAPLSVPVSMTANLDMAAMNMNGGPAPLPHLPPPPLSYGSKQRQQLEKVPQQPASSSSSSSSRVSVPVRHIEHEYMIGDQIGAGMCGTVHMCLHRATRRKFAVKIIDSKKFGLNSGLSSVDLREEAQMMRSLNHPHIIKVVDTFDVDGVIFIVMEHVSGGDLLDRVVEIQRFTEPEARRIMRSVLGAVKYLHANGIVHRDLKPENILLSAQEVRVSRRESTLSHTTSSSVDSHSINGNKNINYSDRNSNHNTHSNNNNNNNNNDNVDGVSWDVADVKITDFGLAKRTNQDGLKSFCGTPQYFAPEVLKRKSTLKGAGRYGTSADMWSMGVVLYILLSGTFPFNEETLYDQIQVAHYSMTGPEWTKVSREAKDLIRQLLQLRPHDRLTAEKALNHPWIHNKPLPPVDAWNATLGGSITMRSSQSQSQSRSKHRSQSKGGDRGSQNRDANKNKSNNNNSNNSGTSQTQMWAYTSSSNARKNSSSKAAKSPVVKTTDATVAPSTDISDLSNGDHIKKKSSNVNNNNNGSMSANNVVVNTGLCNLFWARRSRSSEGANAVIASKSTSTSLGISTLPHTNVDVVLEAQQQVDAAVTAVAGPSDSISASTSLADTSARTSINTKSALASKYTSMKGKKNHRMKRNEASQQKSQSQLQTQHKSRGKRSRDCDNLGDGADDEKKDLSDDTIHEFDSDSDCDSVDDVEDEGTSIEKTDANNDGHGAMNEASREWQQQRQRYVKGGSDRSSSSNIYRSGGGSSNTRSRHGHLEKEKNAKQKKSIRSDLLFSNPTTAVAASASVSTSVTNMSFPTFPPPSSATTINQDKAPAILNLSSTSATSILDTTLVSTTTTTHATTTETESGVMNRGVLREMKASDNDNLTSKTEAIKSNVSKFSSGRNSSSSSSGKSISKSSKSKSKSLSSKGGSRSSSSIRGKKTKTSMNSNGNGSCSGNGSRARQVLRPGFHTIKDFLSVNPSMSSNMTTSNASATTTTSTTAQVEKLGKSLKPTTMESENNTQNKHLENDHDDGINPELLKDLVSVDVPMFKRT